MCIELTSRLDVSHPRVETAGGNVTAGGRRSRTAPAWVRSHHGEAGGDGESVDEVVHLVAGVALHPVEGDVVVARDRGDQWLPEVAVHHRLLSRRHPAVEQPLLPPAVAEAVHDVRRVADDEEWPRQGADGLQ